MVHSRLLVYMAFTYIHFSGTSTQRMMTVKCVTVLFFFFFATLFIYLNFCFTFNRFCKLVKHQRDIQSLDTEHPRSRTIVCRLNFKHITLSRYTKRYDSKFVYIKILNFNRIIRAVEFII